jgi:hypothetical protein
VDETCQCQSANHGHEPGACPNAPTEADHLCKPCHADKAAAEGMGWFMPLSEPPRVTRFVEGTTVSGGASLEVARAPDFGSPNYERPPADHAIYYLVGRVSAEWARYEHALDRLIWCLAGTISSRAACLTAQFVGATPRFHALIAQLHLRQGIEPEFGRYQPRVQKMMNDTYEPQERRNRIVHDAWFLDTNTDAPGQYRSWPRKDLRFGINPVDWDYVNEAIILIERLACRAEQLFDEINNDVLARKK